MEKCLERHAARNTQHFKITSVFAKMQAEQGARLSAGGRARRHAALRAAPAGLAARRRTVRCRVPTFARTLLAAEPKIVAVAMGFDDGVCRLGTQGLESASADRALADGDRALGIDDELVGLHPHRSRRDIRLSRPQRRQNKNRRNIRVDGILHTTGPFWSNTSSTSVETGNLVFAAARGLPQHCDCPLRQAHDFPVTIR
jgi:hypothetical protein